MTARGRRAGVILCGGRSSRMGRPKHLLELHGRTFFDWCRSALEEVVGEIVVSLAKEQEAPSTANVTVFFDDFSDSGPLAGVAASLERCTAAHVAIVSCDAPLVSTKLLGLLFDEVGDHDAAIGVVGGRLQFFPGVYRRETGTRAREMVERGQLSMAKFVEGCRVLRVPEKRIRSCDAGLDSFRNVNTPEEYAAMVERR